MSRNKSRAPKRSRTYWRWSGCRCKCTQTLENWRVKQRNWRHLWPFKAWLIDMNRLLKLGSHAGGLTVSCHESCNHFSFIANCINVIWSKQQKWSALSYTQTLDKILKHSVWTSGYILPFSLKSTGMKYWYVVLLYIFSTLTGRTQLCFK